MTLDGLRLKAEEAAFFATRKALSAVLIRSHAAPGFIIGITSSLSS